MSAATCPAGTADDPCSHGKVHGKGLCKRHYYRAYQQTPERKAYQRAYQQTPEYKAAKRARRSTPEYKAAERARYQTPEYKAARRAYVLLTKYGITAAAYDALLAGGPFGADRCWSCGTTEAKGAHGAFNVDHDRDHPGVSRGVRGILCTPCNRGHGEGNDMDTIAGVRRWLAYLENGPARAQRIIAETEDELAGIEVAA